MDADGPGIQEEAAALVDTGGISESLSKKHGISNLSCHLLAVLWMNWSTSGHFHTRA